MLADLVDALVWALRLVLLAGLGWGGWLCVSDILPPAQPDNAPGFERFAAYALLILLLTTLGSILHAV